MRRIEVLDTTLRDGEQAPGCSMALGQKLEVARALERLGVDVVEAGFPISSPDDFEAVKAIAGEIRGCKIAALCRCTVGDISCAWEAIKGAKRPRLHVFLATSDIHMKYKLKLTRGQVLERVESAIRFAKKHCDEVMFSAEDATRSDRAFLFEVFDVAVREGTTVLNIPDTVGYAVPSEMAELVRAAKAEFGSDEVKIGVHCHDDLGLAVANTLCAVEAGADHVDVALGGLGERAGNAALEEVVMGLHTRREHFGCETGVVTQEINHAGRLLFNLIEQEIPFNKAILGANAFAHESGIHQHGVLSNPMTYEIMAPEDVGVQVSRMVLGKHSGKAALYDRLSELGYELDEKALEAVFKDFKVMADRRKALSDRDLHLLVKGATTTKRAYALHSFVTNSGTLIPATAVVKLLHDGKEIEKVATGESPVIAAFNAVDKAVRNSYPLHKFTIQSISEGRDAQSECTVQVLVGERVVAGRGMSTDIVKACIKAYLNAINKILAA